MAKQVEIKTKVVGVNYNDPKSGKSRQEIIKQHIRPGTDLVAKLEPDNAHDPNAIAIYFEKKGLLFGKTQYHLGYLSEELAAELAPLLRKGTVLKIDVLAVSGGTKEKPSRGVNIVIRY